MWHIKMNQLYIHIIHSIYVALEAPLLGKNQKYKKIFRLRWSMKNKNIFLYTRAIQYI